MRCYNGCPDEKLSALLLYERNLREQLAKAHNEARCVYFPNGDFYLCFVGARGLWETESKSLQTSIMAAIETLRVA